MPNNTETFTTCPYTGEKDSWTEEAFDNGKWKGRSTVTGATVTAESYEALRLRYNKVETARLEAEAAEKAQETE